ncbi:MAG: carbohydrate ABC transporter permease [Christensenellales bacterium]|jgi:putative aldouronate transport system permease protein
MIKASIAQRIFNVFNIAFLCILCFVALYPVYFVLVASLSDSSLLLKHTGILMGPLGFSLEAYRSVMINPNIYTGYGNTLFIVLVGTSLNLAVTSGAAYALSRRSMTTRVPVMMGIIFTMMFSGGLIPLFLVVRDLGLYNSRWSLILPTLVNATNLTIMRTSFQEIPASLEESAKIDGANDLVVFSRIVLPLSKAVIAVICLYYGVAHWNSWFHASIFLRDRRLFPLQLILREILIMNDTTAMDSSGSVGDAEMIGESIKYATIIVSTLPILLLYPYLQKYFVKGIMIGAVKG